MPLRITNTIIGKTCELYKNGKELKIENIYKKFGE